MRQYPAAGGVKLLGGGAPSRHLAPAALQNGELVCQGMPHVSPPRGKDAATTQGSVGFRVSGLQVYRLAEGSTFKPPRDWGKTLTKENIGSVFELFASNGECGRFHYR